MSLQAGTDITAILWKEFQSSQVQVQLDQSHNLYNINNTDSLEPGNVVKRNRLGSRHKRNYDKIGGNTKTNKKYRKRRYFIGNLDKELTEKYDYDKQTSSHILQRQNSPTRTIKDHLYTKEALYSAKIVHLYNSVYDIINCEMTETQHFSSLSDNILDLKNGRPNHELKDGRPNLEKIKVNNNKNLTGKIYNTMKKIIFKLPTVMVLTKGGVIGQEEGEINRGEKNPSEINRGPELGETELKEPEYEQEILSKEVATNLSNLGNFIDLRKCKNTVYYVLSDFVIRKGTIHPHVIYNNVPGWLYDAVNKSMETEPRLHLIYSTDMRGVNEWLGQLCSLINLHNLFAADLEANQKLNCSAILIHLAGLLSNHPLNSINRQGMSFPDSILQKSTFENVNKCLADIHGRDNLSSFVSSTLACVPHKTGTNSFDLICGQN